MEYCRAIVQKKVIKELKSIKQQMNMSGITLEELEHLKERVQELSKKLSYFDK